MEEAKAKQEDHTHMLYQNNKILGSMLRELARSINTLHKD